MRNLIGFDTPTKAKLQEELNNNSNHLQLGLKANGGLLKSETLERLSQLGNTICGNEFQKYEPQHRQQILLDFVYYSKVADSIL